MVLPINNFISIRNDQLISESELNKFGHLKKSIPMTVPDILRLPVQY